MTFYLRMAWRSLRRTPGVTVVMVLALSLGIGTWYAQHQVFAYLATKTPTARSDVYHLALERGETSPPAGTRPSIVTPWLGSLLLTPRDAQGVLAGASSLRRTLTFGAPALLEPADQPAETVRVRYATRDLFEMFEIPLAAGQPWSAVADAGLLAGTPGDEAVIGERLAQRLFGSAKAAVGNRVRVDGADVRVVGVVAMAHRERYHLYERMVPATVSVYLPLAHATAAHAEPDFQYVVAGGETGSIGVWVELPTAAARALALTHIDAHLARERATGRTATPRAATLRSVGDMQAMFKPGGTINLWPLLTTMCLLTCVVNLVRMLMVKFGGRRHDLGLLRAFGARRRGVMGQLLLEAAGIGLIAGVCGLALGVAMMPLAISTIEGTPAGITGSPTVFSLGAAVTTVGASIASALLAALYPAWRLSRGTPAMQLGRS